MYSMTDVASSYHSNDQVNKVEPKEGSKAESETESKTGPEAEPEAESEAESEAKTEGKTDADIKIEEIGDEHKFDPDTEKLLVEEAEKTKLEGNIIFNSGIDYEKAISLYKQSLAKCPDYRTDLTSIYWCNISACQFKLEEYQEAVSSATKSIELQPKYAKALLRRSNANEKINTWASLESSSKDLQVLSEQLQGEARNDVIRRMKLLDEKTKEARERETQQVVGKLKDLGNGILKNFGLSLDNFQMAQDSTGGYSMNFKN